MEFKESYKACLPIYVPKFYCSYLENIFEWFSGFVEYKKMVYD